MTLRRWLGFHEHDFKVLSAAYAPPVQDEFWSHQILLTHMANPRKAALMQTGFTTTLYGCACGKTEIVEVAGDHTGELKSK